MAYQYIRYYWINIFKLYTCTYPHHLCILKIFLCLLLDKFTKSFVLRIIEIWNCNVKMQYEQKQQLYCLYYVCFL